MRWITLFGRIGTVLLMVGLALALVSLIPPATVGFTSWTIGPIMPEKYRIAHSQTYTPQTGLRISVESNNSVYVYLLSVSQPQIENWTRTWVEETFPDLEEVQILTAMHNITVLDEVLQTRSDTILWKSASSKDLSHDFFPSNVLNVTAIVANPSPNLIEIKTEIRGITALAPRERVIVPAQWLIPIGIVLAIPWLVLSKTKKD